jgi:TPR repeat protein
MPVVTMPAMKANFRNTFGATLPDLFRYLSSSRSIQISEGECESLAAAAVGGQPEAEFMVGSIFDATGEPDCAVEWYSRAADRGYLPAMLQLCAVR